MIRMYKGLCKVEENFKIIGGKEFFKWLCLL